MPKVRLFFIDDSIQTVFSNNIATLRKDLNLDFSHEVSTEKQVTFSVKVHNVYQQINATSIVHEPTYFSASLVAVKALFVSEINE